MLGPFYSKHMISAHDLSLVIKLRLTALGSKVKKRKVTNTNRSSMVMPTMEAEWGISSSLLSGFVN